jgi:hypothetical protein
MTESTSSPASEEPPSGVNALGQSAAAGGAAPGHAPTAEGSGGDGGERSSEHDDVDPDRDEGEGT